MGEQTGAEPAPGTAIKSKGLHRVPGNDIYPNWKSTEKGGQFPKSLILPTF